MIGIIEAHAQIITSYEIKRFRQYGGAYEFVAQIDFVDGSILHVRDYVFLNGDRKDSFHWLDEQLQLIRRWDNSPHHPHLSMFPFHVHTPSSVEESLPMTLQKVLAYIRQQLYNASA